jgi:hypothetical protein
VHGRIVMHDLSQPFVLEVDKEPLDFWLDRRGEVLARFFAESRAPKLALQEEAARFAAEGKTAEAVAAYRQSLEIAPGSAARSSPDEDERLTAERASRQDAVAHLGLARLCLDAGDMACAATELASARRKTDRLSLFSAREELLLLQARFDLLRGEAGSAWSALKRGIADRGAPGPEGQALMALAARAAGHDDSYRRALAIARKRGVDLSALGEPRTPQSWINPAAPSSGTTTATSASPAMRPEAMGVR